MHRLMVLVFKSTKRCIFFAVTFLYACSSSKQNNRLKPVARVNEMLLYTEDLKDIVPPGTSKDDSIKLVSKYIDNWIRETLVVQKAEDNLTAEQKNVEEQLLDYRKSLIIYAYERELVRQQLDTFVSNTEIEKYYQDNKNNFELKDNIIKVNYIKVLKDAPNINKLKMWYKSDDQKDVNDLAGYCHQYAENFYLDDNAWLLFDDLLKEVPIKMYDKELFLQNNRFVEAEDSLHYYFVNIKGFKIKNSLSPLSFEKENIRNVILNKRKLELINRMKQGIYNDAVKNKKFKIFS